MSRAPGDSLKHIKHEINVASGVEKHKTEVAEYASAVLLGRGDFVIAQHDWYQSIGSNLMPWIQGTLLAQATQPVKIDSGEYVYLRHELKESSKKIELVSTKSEDTDLLAQPNRLLAVFDLSESPTVEMPAIGKIPNTQYGRELVGEISQIIDAIGPDVVPPLSGENFNRNLALERGFSLPKTQEGQTIPQGVHPIGNIQAHKGNLTKVL